MRVVVAAFVALVLTGAAAPAGAAEEGRSRAAYVRALVPVVQEEFGNDNVTGSAQTFECVAEGYVDGFTLRRLQGIGSPSRVAKLRAGQSSDARLGVSSTQEKRIVSAAVLGCLPIAELLRVGLRARGVSLSNASVACLNARFEGDRAAEAAYGQAAVRQVLGKDPRITPDLARAGQYLLECLTPEEQRAIQGG